ncbi:MAG: hypothetical protein JNK33_05170, partial [Candidatus Doudnabacteria bacterium]|nr:hypothetical protein [Candidatus Doudnabacteria bacterium]
GVTAYEYTYTWCITDSAVNTCGDGNDIFSSTAAKLIQAGENFDTTLNSIIASSGTYWFHVVAQFGSDSSEAVQSFVATTGTVVTPSDNGGGGGGGGAGGGTGGVGVTPPVAPVAPVNPEVPIVASPITADLNGDNVVDSTDFSIMLAFWKTKAPFKNPGVDLNRDGRVDSVDFSIMLYQWKRRK